MAKNYKRLTRATKRVRGLPRVNGETRLRDSVFGLSKNEDGGRGSGIVQCVRRVKRTRRGNEPSPMTTITSRILDPGCICVSVASALERAEPYVPVIALSSPRRRPRSRRNKDLIVRP